MGLIWPFKVLCMISYDIYDNICYKTCIKWERKWHSRISVLIIIGCFLLFHNEKICSGYRRMRLYPDIDAYASKWCAPISEVTGYYIYFLMNIFCRSFRPQLFPDISTKRLFRKNANEISFKIFVNANCFSC